MDDGWGFNEALYRWPRTENYRGLGKCCDVIFLRPNSFGCTTDNKPSLTPSEPDVEMMKVRFIRREISR